MDMKESLEFHIDIAKNDQRVALFRGDLVGVADMQRRIEDLTAQLNELD